MDPLFCYHVVLMILATIAFTLLWIGFATPGWLVVTFQETEAASEHTVSSLNVSLFYELLCPQEYGDCMTCRQGDHAKKCVTDMGYPKYTSHYTWIENLTSDTEEWVAWGLMMVIVVLVCSVGFILVLCLVCCILKTRVYKYVATSAFICWLVGGLLVWVPVGMIAHMHLDIDDPIKTDHALPLVISHDASLHIPYSVVITAVAGFLALVVALMLLYLTGVCGNSKDRYSDRSDTEVFSEPKMRTTVIAPADRYYYGPTPYYPPDRQVYYRDEPTVVRSVPTEEIVVDDYPHYKGTPARWGPNPHYDNRSGW
ncbi:hypothetical protein ACF0H5_013900 [Mactra antiquata]